MKKLWTKFKHWLIKKLGGYVNAPVRPIIHQYGEHEVVTLTSSMHANYRFWHNVLGERESAHYRESVMRTVKRGLADEIFDNIDQFADINCSGSTDTDAVIVSATVRIVKTN